MCFWIVWTVKNYSVLSVRKVGVQTLARKWSGGSIEILLDSGFSDNCNETYSLLSRPVQTYSNLFYPLRDAPELSGGRGRLLVQSTMCFADPSPPSPLSELHQSAAGSAGGGSRISGARGRIPVRMGNSIRKFSKPNFVQNISMMCGNVLGDSRRC